jgi:hypothetical protein
MSGSTSLASALLAFQADPPVVVKDRSNDHFHAKYVSLGSLMDAALPKLNEHGLAWVTLPGSDVNGEPTLAYRLLHAQTGEVLEGTMPLLVSKRDPQGMGSALTYARRQSLMAVLGLVADDDDDDGNAASRLGPARPREQAPASRLLTVEERDRVLAAIKDSGEPVQLVLAAIGALSSDTLTAGDARRVKLFLDRVAAAEPDETIDMRDSAA